MIEARTREVLEAVYAERVAQFKKWGDQDHDLGTWSAILGEEYGEVCRAIVELQTNGVILPDNLREELVHVAAVAVQILELI